MTVHVTCPRCVKRLVAKPQPGRRVRCPQCKMLLPIPEASAETIVQATAVEHEYGPPLRAVKRAPAVPVRALLAVGAAALLGAVGLAYFAAPGKSKYVPKAEPVAVASAERPASPVPVALQPRVEVEAQPLPEPLAASGLLTSGDLGAVELPEPPLPPPPPVPV